MLYLKKTTKSWTFGWSLRLNLYYFLLKTWILESVHNFQLIFWEASAFKLRPIIQNRILIWNVTQTWDSLKPRKLTSVCCLEAENLSVFHRNYAGINEKFQNSQLFWVPGRFRQNKYSFRLQSGKSDLHYNIWDSLVHDKLSIKEYCARDICDVRKVEDLRRISRSMRSATWSNEKFALKGK